MGTGEPQTSSAERREATRFPIVKPARDSKSVGKGVISRVAAIARVAEVAIARAEPAQAIVRLAVADQAVQAPAIDPLAAADQAVQVQATARLAEAADQAVQVQAIDLAAAVAIFLRVAAPRAGVEDLVEAAPAATAAAARARAAAVARRA